MSTIFYSWQSDRPNRLNRGLIETALERAIREVGKDPEIESAPRELDKDTAGIPGSPAIADAIFGKIAAAEVCVFDVSIATACDGQRSTPNPNVLLELGFALHALSWERVILVLNDCWGGPELLPFDLRGRRVVQYSLDEQGNIADARALLGDRLANMLKHIYRHLQQDRGQAERFDAYEYLYANLSEFTESIAEFDARTNAGQLGSVQGGWLNVARSLRRVVLIDVIQASAGCVDDLTSLAGVLEELARFQVELGGGRQLRQRAVTTGEAAQRLRATCMPVLRDRYSRQDFSPEKRRLARSAASGHRRLSDLIARQDSTGRSDVRQELAGTGRDLLRLARKLEVVGDTDTAIIRDAGHVAHVATLRESNESGFRDDIRLRDVLAPYVKELQERYLGN